MRIVVLFTNVFSLTNNFTSGRPVVLVLNGALGEKMRPFVFYSHEALTEELCYRLYYDAFMLFTVELSYLTKGSYFFFKTYKSGKAPPWRLI